MGSKTGSFDEDISTNGNSTKEMNTSMIVNVNDTQTDIDNDSNYSNRSENNMDYDDDNSDASKGKKSSNSGSESGYKKDDRSNNKKKSPGKDSKLKVDTKNTRYLWVNGIPNGTKTDQLKEVFQEHGNVLAIKIIRGGSSLLGFVKLETIDQAQNCMEKINKTSFRGNTIEIFKERPPDSEKIGFSDSRKFSTPKSRPPFRPSRRSYRVHSTPKSPRISHRAIRDRRSRTDFNLERERHKLKMERIKLERDKAELLKLERESHRSFDRDRHDEKRVRSINKRSYDDSYHNDDKRFEDYNRREDYSSRRYDNNSERKMSRSFGSRGRYEDNLRSDRYSDKYDQFDKSSKSWQTAPDLSWNNSGDRWNNSNYDSSRLISNIGSSSISRLHSDISSTIPTRNYFNNRRY